MSHLVLVTMDYSDDNAPDEIFGPFPSHTEARAWSDAHVNSRHDVRINQAMLPEKEASMKDDWRWWRR